MLMKLRPSPAMTIAVIALFAALAGSAIGAGAVVGYAKKAGYANKAGLAKNASKLQGKTAQQVVDMVPAPEIPPVASVSGLTSIKKGAWAQAGASFQGYTVNCDSGQKAIGGGWDQTNPTAGGVSSLSSFPTADGSGWTVWIWNLTGSHSGTTYAVCLK
jgi:hypothetical protein